MKTQRGIANLGFSSIRRGIAHFNFSCNLTGTRPKPLTGNTSNVVANDNMMECKKELAIEEMPLNTKRRKHKNYFET
jgi:hypothetical protein